MKKKINFVPKDNYKKLDLHCWFPTTIGVVDCPFYEEIKNSILNFFEINENDDLGYVYFPIHKQTMPFFLKLTNWIQSQVNEYAKIHNYGFDYEAGESWLIDYKKYSYNPWHKHNGWTISTNFFLLTDKKDSHTQFRSPTYGDMLNPLNLNTHQAPNKENYNDLTSPTCSYAPIPGRLLIFRSSTEHMTDFKKTQKRIIMSYNFNPKQKKTI
jgi:hypothetical protein